MTIISVEEFQWSLKRLLREGFPQGIPLEALSTTYRQWLGKTVESKLIDTRSNNWKMVFQANSLLRETFKITRDEIPLVKLRNDGNETSLEELREVFELVKYANVVMMRAMQSYCMEESNDIGNNRTPVTIGTTTEADTTNMPLINSVQSTEPIDLVSDNLEPGNKKSHTAASYNCLEKPVQTTKFKRRKKLTSSLLKNENIENESSARRLGRKRKHNGHHCNNYNPLLNDLVLEPVFKFVQEKDLLACRLVCKQWNLLSLPFIQSNQHIDIKWKGSSGRQKREIEDFMNLMRSNTLGIPFESFSVPPFDLEPTKGQEGVGQQFIQICGPTAKQIILHDDHNHRHKIQNVSKLLQSTPNLRSFTMPKDMNTRSGIADGKTVKLFNNTVPKPTFNFLVSLDVGLECPRRRMQICPTFYEELLKAAPNISTIYMDTVQQQTPNAALEVLQAIRKLGREKSIETLSLPHVTEDHLNVFLSMSTELNFKQLALTYNATDNVTNEFVGFELISMFKNTLIAFRYDFNYNPHAQNPAVVLFNDQMPNLKLLQLRLNWEVSLECENFNRTFPALETIDIQFNIRDDGNYNDHNIIIGNEPCSIPTLKSSIICCLPITMDRLDRILTIFPTLKILKCQVTIKDGVKVIRKIWRCMTQLERLHIYGEVGETVSIDSLITGIPAKRIRNNMGNMESFFQSLEPLEIEVRRQKITVERNKHYRTRDVRFPSISNLTNLRSLELNLTEGKKGKMKMPLSDVGGYFGLYSLKNLQHLNVSNCKFTKSCAEILVKDKNLMTWKFKPAGFRAQDIIPGTWKQDQITENLDYFPLLNV